MRGAYRLHDIVVWPLCHRRILSHLRLECRRACLHQHVAVTCEIPPERLDFFPSSSDERSENTWERQSRSHVDELTGRQNNLSIHSKQEGLSSEYRSVGLALVLSAASNDFRVGLCSIVPMKFTRRSRDNGLGSSGAVAFFAASVALLWPVAVVAAHGWTLTGLYEELVGIRYFYSLRSLYEPGAFLFLPQGQLINLYHKAIQVALSEFGLPPRSLWPRIDLFCYISIIGLQITNAACFTWMLVPIRTVAARAIAGSICLLVLYSRHLSFFYALLQPDYVAIEPAVVFLTVGMMLRTRDGVKISSIAMTVAVGLTLAVKPTLALLPATAGAYALLSAGPNRATLIKGGALLAGAAALWLLIWFADQNFDLRLFGKSLYYFAAFIYTRGGMAPNAMDWLSWIVLRVQTPPVLIALSYATPALCAVALVAAICARQRSVSLALAVLLALSVGEHIFLYERDYAITLMEFASVVLIIALLLTAQLDVRLRQSSILSNVGAIAACAFTIAVFCDGGVLGNLGRQRRRKHGRAAAPSFAQPTRVPALVDH